MSDNLRRYLAIRDALWQWYPASLNGHQARHLIALAMLLSGIVGCQHSHLDKVAAQVPSAAKPPSRTKRFARWVANDASTSTIYYVPFAEMLLASLAHRPLVLVLDGSTVGRGCVALMLSVLYGGRALPVTWLVAEGCCATIRTGVLPHERILLCGVSLPHERAYHTHERSYPLLCHLAGCASRVGACAAVRSALPRQVKAARGPL